MHLFITHYMESKGGSALLQSLILLRHGIRQDFEDKTWRKTASRPHDTPLSENGLKQAHDAGRFLQKEKIDYVFASPFLRALQTADIVASYLDLPIFVEYGFMERLDPHWFESMPEIMSKEEAKARFPRIDTSYESFLFPTFPEPRHTTLTIDRIAKALSQIHQHYDGSALVVSHGVVSIEGARALIGSEEGVLGHLCSSNKFVFEDNIWQLEWATREYLSVTEEMVRFH
jgi:broad specificity phosphatase PhoE